MTALAPTAYTGIENLEVMAAAENYNRYLASLIEDQLAPGHAVLDFGAGAGTFALPLQARGVNLVCVEPDGRLGERLRQAGVRTVARLDEIADESIDLAYTFNVLEHIQDDTAAVRALAAKLKPGGRLVAYVPAFEILFSAMDRQVGHVRRYRRNALAHLLTASGLRLIDARYADSLGFPAALLYRLSGNDAGAVNPTALKIYDRLIFPLSRAVDLLLSRWVGKNVVALAEKR